MTELPKTISGKIRRATIRDKDKEAADAEAQKAENAESTANENAEAPADNNASGAES